MAYDSMTPSKTWYAIREVAEITGVKPVTLRAWQRRYNLIQPHRTDKGHRLYNDDHIAHIRSIQHWLGKGIAIGKVKALLDSPQAKDGIQESPQELDEVGELLGALAQLQRGKVEAVIARTFKEYPLDIAQKAFVEPIQLAIANMSKPKRALQHGLFQALMSVKLGMILESENRAAHRGHCLVVNCEASGHLNAWIWAIELAGKGVKVTLLDGVSELRGLADNTILSGYDQLAIYAEHLPTVTQRNVLSQLEQQYPIQYSAVLKSLLAPGEKQ